MYYFFSKKPLLLINHENKIEKLEKIVFFVKNKRANAASR